MTPEFVLDSGVFAVPAGLPPIPKPPPPPRQPDTRHINPLAVASLALGVVWPFFPFGGCVLSPVGFVLGIVALVTVNQRPQEQKGAGMALLGLLLGFAGMVWVSVGTLKLFSIFTGG